MHPTLLSLDMTAAQPALHAVTTGQPTIGATSPEQAATFLRGWVAQATSVAVALGIDLPIPDDVEAADPELTPPLQMATGAHRAPTVAPEQANAGEAAAGAVAARLATLDPGKVGAVIQMGIGLQDHAEQLAEDVARIAPANTTKPFAQRVVDIVTATAPPPA